MTGASKEEQPRIASLEDEVRKLKQKVADVTTVADAVHSELPPNLKQQVNGKAYTSMYVVHLNSTFSAIY